MTQCTFCPREPDRTIYGTFAVCAYCKIAFEEGYMFKRAHKKKKEVKEWTSETASGC